MTISHAPYPRQPKTPLWPIAGEIPAPNTKPMPFVNAGDSWWKRVWAVIAKRRLHILEEDYFVYIPSMFVWVWIPMNFVCDNASIPKPIPINPDGIFYEASFPHDFGCRFGGLLVSEGVGDAYHFVKLPRKTIDKIFREVNNLKNGLKVLNGASYYAVRLGSLLPRTIQPIYDVDWNKPVMPTFRLS